MRCFFEPRQFLARGCLSVVPWDPPPSTFRDAEQFLCCAPWCACEGQESSTVGACHVFWTFYLMVAKNHLSLFTFHLSLFSFHLFPFTFRFSLSTFHFSLFTFTFHLSLSNFEMVTYRDGSSLFLPFGARAQNVVLPKVFEGFCLTVRFSKWPSCPP